MLITRMTAIAHWFLRFIYVQCFLMIISLPILLCWGLPISAYSILGNLLFGPVITLFLIASGAFFVCELLHIPTVYSVWCLEQITHLWHTLLSWSKHEWLIGFAQPPLLFLCMLPVCALYVLGRLAPAPAWRKACVMSISFIALCCLLRIVAPCQPPIIKLPCNKGYLTLISHKGTACLIDPGVLGQRKSLDSWLQYTFVPNLIRTTGCTVIDHMILLQANRTTLKGMVALSEKIRIHNLYLPAAASTLDPECMRALDSLQVNVVSLDTVQITLGSEENCLGTLQPIAKRMQKNGTLHPKFMFQGSIDNHQVTIYPFDYTKRNKDVSYKV